MGALQGALGLWAQGFRPSEPPTGRLHRLCVVGLVGLLGARQGIHHARALRVVVLIDIASLVLAIHGLALHAAVVLLLLEAATDILLCTRAAVTRPASSFSAQGLPCCIAHFWYPWARVSSHPLQGSCSWRASLRVSSAEASAASTAVTFIAAAMALRGLH